MSIAILGSAAAALAVAVSPASGDDEAARDELGAAGPRLARVVDGGGAAGEDVIRPRLGVRCILALVLGRMRVAHRGDVELPEVLFESTTPLSQFQDAIAPQWGFRPHVFANAYVPDRNEIYLLDAASSYGRSQRTIEDSLAHELTHFVQAKYLGLRWEDAPFAENQAIAVQTWFRDERARGALSRESCESHFGP